MGPGQGSGECSSKLRCGLVIRVYIGILKGTVNAIKDYRTLHEDGPLWEGSTHPAVLVVSALKGIPCPLSLVGRVPSLQASLSHIELKKICLYINDNEKNTNHYIGLSMISNHFVSPVV